MGTWGFGHINRSNILYKALAVRLCVFFIIGIIVFSSSAGSVSSNETGNSQIIKITDDDSNRYSPKIYGEKIVCQEERGGNYNIYMYDVLTKEETQLTDNNTAFGPPDIYGDKIVWIDRRNGALDVYMYDISSGTETRLTDVSGFYGPVKIYGEKIAWKDSSSYSYKTVCVYDCETRDLTFVPYPDLLCLGYRAFFNSINEDKLIFTQEGFADSNLPQRIIVYNIDAGQELKRITLRGSYYFRDIYEDKLAAISREEPYEVYVLDLLEEQLILIADDMYDSRTLRRAALYGRNIIFTSLEDNILNLYLYDMANMAPGEKEQLSYHGALSIDIHENNIIWLGNDKNIYLITLDTPQIISIELVGQGGKRATWLLDDVVLGDTIYNTDDETILGEPEHILKNTGTVDVDVDMNYVNWTGIIPSHDAGVDHFYTSVLLESGELAVIRPPYSRMQDTVIRRNFAPGAVSPLAICYGAPTGLTNPIEGMTADYGLRAYPAVE